MMTIKTRIRQAHIHAVTRIIIAIRVEAARHVWRVVGTEVRHVVRAAVGGAPGGQLAGACWCLCFVSLWLVEEGG